MSFESVYIINSITFCLIEDGNTQDLLRRAESVAVVPARHAFHPTYCHSFGMSENYFIFCETPVTMNLIKTLTRVMTNTPINDVFNYDPEAMVSFLTVA